MFNEMIWFLFSLHCRSCRVLFHWGSPLLFLCVYSSITVISMINFPIFVVVYPISLLLGDPLNISSKPKAHEIRFCSRGKAVIDLDAVRMKSDREMWADSFFDCFFFAEAFSSFSSIALVKISVASILCER